MSVPKDVEHIFDHQLQMIRDHWDKTLGLKTGFPIEREDPDVDRLIESMALLLANNHVLGAQQQEVLHGRFLDESLPYVRRPVPAMALVEANVSGLIDAQTVHAGELFSFQTEEGDRAQFQALLTTVLQPIRLKKTLLQSTTVYDHGLVLNIEALKNRKGCGITELPFYVCAQDHLEQAVIAHQFILKHSVHCVCIFDDEIKVSGQIVPKTISQENANAECSSASYLNPIESERRFFACPQQSMMFSLMLDEAPPIWKTLSINIGFNQPWPQEVEVNSHLLKLFVIPVLNEIHQPTLPQSFNGTQSTVQFEEPEGITKPCLSRLKGVYQNTKNGPLLLSSGYLTDRPAEPSMDHRFSAEEDCARGLKIQLNAPQAFDEPISIFADAYWHQPEFSGHLWKKITVKPSHAKKTMAKWGLRGRITPCASPEPLNNEESLHLVALKNKSVLQWDDLQVLFNVVGVNQSKYFSDVTSNLEAMIPMVLYHGSEKNVGDEAQKEAWKHREGSTRPELNSIKCVKYLCQFKGHDHLNSAMIHLFMAHIEHMIQSWCAFVPIKVMACHDQPKETKHLEKRQAYAL